MTKEQHERYLLYQRRYREAHKETRLAKAREYYSANRQARLAYAREHYKDNRDALLAKIRAYYPKYYAANKVKVLAKTSSYAKKNRVRLAARERERYHTDPCFRLARLLRRRLKLALLNNFKSGSAVRDLGCTIAELKLHIEKQFLPGMTWDNRGQWHIDHIKPLASFDLTRREQLLVACHYTNLQPLWAADNLSKGARR